jgi:UDP-N-acetylmuramate dehydrogenase
MVNLGQATSADVIGLVRHAQKAVKEKFGYELEPEINFLGEF